MRLCVSFLVLLFVGPQFLGGQSPLISVYDPSDQGVSKINFSIAQGSNGIMYFANREGLLSFDGEHWQTHYVQGRTVRDLYSLGDTVFIGTLNNIGWFSSSDPFLKINWLKQTLPDKGEGLKTVFSIQKVGNSMYFETQKEVLKLDLQASEWRLSSIPVPETVETLDGAGGELFLIGDQNIWRLEDDEFKPWRPARLANGVELFSILPASGGSYLMEASDGTVRKFGKDPRGNGDIIFSSDRDIGVMADWYFGEDSDLIEGGYRYYLPTNNLGLVVLNEDGSLVDVIGADDGLAGNGVYFTKIDQEGNVWVVGSGGISKISLTYPVQRFETRAWDQRKIHSLYEDDNILYVGSDIGLFAGDPQLGTYKNILGVRAQIWQIQPYENGVLVAGGNNGLYYYEPGQRPVNYLTDVAARSVLALRSDPSIIILGLYDGALVFRKTDRQFELITKIDDVEGDVRSIIEDGYGNVWLGTTMSGVYRLNSAGMAGSFEVQRYGKAQGLSSMEHNWIEGTPEMPIFSSRDSLYQFNADRNRFEPIILKNHKLGLYPSVKNIGNETVWLLHDKVILDGDFATRDSLFLRSIPGQISAIHINEDGSGKVATDRGLFSIPASNGTSSTKVPLILTTSHIRDGQVIRVRGDGKIVSIAGPPNEFTFTFSSPSFIAEEVTTYRYILEGLNAEWRPFSDFTEITYSDIQPGRYTFKVQAANVFGAKSPIITAEIDIESPWYLSDTAYILYIVGGIVLVFGLVRINSYRLVKRNEYLVNLVEARTEEIKLQNEQLARQAEEIQQINDVRSKLMRMAIHDLRNPLHVLGGYFELLRDAHAHDERIEIYNNSRQVITRMLNKVNRLLDDDRQRYFKEDTAKENIALRDVLVELIRANSILADKKGQSIHSTFDSVGIVHGNREELHEIFDNLINNAIKYSPLNSPINITLERTEDRKTVRVKISDRGMGIADDQLDQIFHTYQQGESKPTGGEFSSGLGLSIARQKVEDMGGRIFAENREDGKGAVFTVELPSI